MNQITILKAKRIIKDVFKDTKYKLVYDDTGYVVTILTGIDPKSLLDKDGEKDYWAVWRTQVTFTYKDFLTQSKSYFYNTISKRVKGM